MNYEQEYEFTELELERLRRASDVTEIQNLMAKYIELMSKMEASKCFELFADQDDISIELAEAGGYDGKDHVKLFLDTYDEYLRNPSDKRGYMDVQLICNPTVLTSKDHKRAEGYWTIIAPGSKWGMEYPNDIEKLVPHWQCGKYYVKFVYENEEWKIKDLKMVLFLRSPFTEGWMKQADCVHMPTFQNIKPDREPDYFTVYNADYGCAYGGIEWGPYLPDSIE